MKTKTIAVIAAVGLLPIAAFSQPAPPAPAAPSVAPVAPVPPVPLLRGPRDRDERMPKVPVTFLGVETSEVPSVVADQLGLAKGFGLVVDYVVPDGPAAAAGVQANDILKMFNDQILTEPDQLAKLVRSNADGASVTLTVLRKGTETKLTAKLANKEVPQRRGGRPWRHGENFGGLGPEFQHEMEQFTEEMKQKGLEMGQHGQELAEQMREKMGDMQSGMIDSAVQSAREEARRAREIARNAAEQARDAAREVRVVSRDNGAIKTTRIDLGKAQIVYNDAQGEMKIETVDNKKMLTAKDPQGRLLFSGPIDTKEELDKVPAEVRQRYDKLEQKDLPGVTPTFTREDDNDADDVDADDESDDADDDDDNDSGNVSMQQVSFPYRRLGINTVLI